MRREVRDRFASGTHANLTAGNACWETAPEVFAQLNEDFGPFDLDLTADADRALCDRWLGAGGLVEDALAGLWSMHGINGYSNPPYGRFVPKILKLAIDEAADGFTSTFLLPLRVTVAFHRYVLAGASDLLFLDKRLIFYENGAPRINAETGKPDGAMFDSVIVRYRAGVHAAPRVGTWRVPRHGKATSTRRAARVELREPVALVA